MHNSKYETRLKEVIKLLKPVDTGHKLIRVGAKDGDGGYLLPNDMKGVAACFSPGVGGNISFEEDLLIRDIPCYLADGTIGRFHPSDDRIHFIKKNLGKEDSRFLRTLLSNFRPKRLINIISQVTLDTWVSNNSDSGDLILQMDIEGDEYEVFDSVHESTLDRFRIIVVEFHNFVNILPYRQYEEGEIMYRVFQKLSNHFHVANIHPNNTSFLYKWGEYEIPNLLEVTFLRKDRVNSCKPFKCLPHQLDCPNVPWNPDIKLPEYWYR